MNENLEQPDLREHPKTYATYGFPAFPQSITESAKRHQQQPEQMEALIQHVKELQEEAKSDQQLRDQLLMELNMWRDGKLALQNEYDEFKRAALTLTTINSIQLAMKVKP